MNPKSKAKSKKTFGFGATALALSILSIWPLEGARANEPAAFAISQVPLFLSSPAPNVLLLLDNSNSFDENANGIPVGSNHNTSKSIVARTSLRSIVANYQGKINLGLMTYKLTGVVASDVDPSVYDASYDPSTYDPSFTTAQALANNWEAFPFTSWTATPYTGVYGGPMTCSAPYACPWGGSVPALGLFSQINWNVAPWNTNSTTGERRGKKIQYMNFANTSDWHLHPYDFIYYNLIQADYGNGPWPMYCYSPDAMGLHGHAAGSPTNPGTGGLTGGQYIQCFRRKAPQNAGLYPDGTLDARGIHLSPNPGNDSSYGFSIPVWTRFVRLIPSDSDYAQNFTTFGRDLVNLGNNVAALGYPAAPTWYSDFTGPGGDLVIPIQPLNAAQVSWLNSQLQCNIPSSWRLAGPYTPPANTTACVGTGIMNAGGTPSPGALQTAQRYLSGQLGAAENNTGQPLADINTTGTAVNNLPNSCNKNYVVFVTDGQPTHKNDGSLYPSAAAALADTVAAAAAIHAMPGGTLVYVIGFGSEVSQSGLDQISAAGGTGHSFIATDGATLDAALGYVFNDVIVQASSAASVSTNSAQFSATTSIFQARFTSADWSGQLLRYETDDLTGAVAAAPTWDASVKVGAQPWQSGGSSPIQRQIITASKPGLADVPGDPVGVPFAWPANPLAPLNTEIRTWQSAALNKSASNVADAQGSLRVNWLRGDHANEGTGMFRARANLLGDLANSFPLYVGPPSSPIDGGSSYYAFKTSYASRPPVIGVGGNDGMFHLFRADTGNELFAYVPTNGYAPNPTGAGAGPRLSQLMTQDYKWHHTYIVDGTANSGDVYYGGAWHTVMLAGSAAGGQTVFALNITNTANDAAKPDPTLTEANAASVLKWEFGDKNTNTGTIDASGNPVGIVNGDPDMGYAFSKPVIAKAHNGSWVAIFGNGYNNTDADDSASATGQAALYVVDISNGRLLKKIIVPVGTALIPNGLSTPRALDATLQGYADYVYAGDLYGNLWKFDLTSASPSNWAIAYSGAPLITVNNVGAAGNRRPITGEIRVSSNPNGGYQVMFGTGRYLATPATDLPVSYANTSLDALYSVWDSGQPVANGRSWLTGQSLGAATTATSGSTYRKLTSNASTACAYGNTPTSQPGCSLGCYVDLKDYPVAGYDGERFTFFPQLSKGLVTFNTITPSNAFCSAGGNTEQVAFNYLTCQSPAFSPFDVTGSGLFNAGDLVNFGVTPSVVGSKILTGITPPGTRVYNSASGITYVYNSSSTGGTPTLDKLKTPNKPGRVSWRYVDKNPTH